MLSPFPRCLWNHNWISILLIWEPWFPPRGGLGVTSMLQRFRANSSPHHLGINLARCHASTHINWLELLIFISTDAGCSDKHTYVIASVRLVMMPCFDPQRIWMSAACGHMISRVWIWGHSMSPDTSELWAAGEKIEMEIIALFSQFFKMWISPHTSFSFFFLIIFNFGKFRRKQTFFCDHTLNVPTVRWYLSSLGCP